MWHLASQVELRPDYFYLRDLERLGRAARGDVFALAKIAGHSSIAITMRYVHPRKDHIETIFENSIGSGSQVGTKVDTVENQAKLSALSY